MKQGPEILAPAGSPEALRAAVECGADAVYLGAGHFNARRHAANFSEEDLEEAVRYCHVRGVKVHLALNTLVSDEELPAAMDLVQTACWLGIDALIVQDLGLARLIRAVAPDLELHASTQMAVMTPEGFRELAALGFRRAVLPRELSLSEIRAIHAAVQDTGMELELFLHGALCMCVSGQCYLSATMGGRSGNRGLCAQPCRLPFSSEGSDHALSLKDLSAVELLPELYEAGVTSFKIEGRMKRPEYVAAAVTVCRNVLEGTPDPERLKQLDAVFSRSGHTDGYVTGNRGDHMFGTRRKDDVVQAAPILKELATLYAKPHRATPVSMVFEAPLGDCPSLTVTGGNPNCSVTVLPEDGYVPELAKTAATTVDKVRTQLQKTGGTGFSVNPEDITVFLAENLYLPASVLNNLRRRALEELADAICDASRTPFSWSAVQDGLNQVWKNYPGASLWDKPVQVVRLSSRDQLPAEVSRRDTAWLLPLDTDPLVWDLLSAKNVPFGVELPRGLYQSTGTVRAFLKKANIHGATFAYAGTLDGVVLAREAGLPVLGGFTLNTFNRQALLEWNRMASGVVLSQELKLSQIKALANSAAQRGPHGTLAIFAYGRSPLMLTRNKPCGLTGTELTDRKGIHFPVVPNGDAYELLNSRPLYLADRLQEFPECMTPLLWFTTESQAEVEQTLIAYEQQLPAEGEFTRCLYYKGVQ